MAKDSVGRLRPGGIGWTKVRIDTVGQDGWCFCTPANPPEDVALGRVDGEWAEESQFFGLVETLSPPDGVGLTRWDMGVAHPYTDPNGKWVRHEDAAAALAAERARGDGLAKALKSVLDACEQGRMMVKPGCSVGGMTIEANIRGSIYNGVPAWPIEEAREVYYAALSIQPEETKP